VKILVIGANGQLGWELMREGDTPAVEMVGTARTQLDITNPDQVKRTIYGIEPDVVINGAAYTNVDGAELARPEAFAVNRDGPGHIAGVCRSAQVPLIHFSTDFVFDGRSTTPYTESDPVSPISVYGKSKAEGEVAVRQNLAAHVIVRTAWLYGVHGHNFLKTMLRLGDEKQVLRVVADQYGSPTAAADLAGVVMAIARRLADGKPVDWGTYHYCGQGVTTWHEFAEMIFEYAGRYHDFGLARIEPIGSADYGAAARRPGYSSLDCRRIQEALGMPTRPWRESLKHTIERIYQ